MGLRVSKKVIELRDAEKKEKRKIMRKENELNGGREEEKKGERKKLVIRK